MKTALLSSLAGAALAATAFAAPTEFNFEDPKGVNNIVFLSDAPLESINGTATGITGKVKFDPAKPEATSGKIVVAVKSLSVANPTMLEHLMGSTWLDVASYPEITFELKSLKDIKKNGDRVEGIAAGVMTIKGKSKEMSVPISLTYLEGMLAERQRVPGDILVARANFSVKRSDFGINAGKQEDKVGDEIELRLSLAGIAPKT